MKIKSPRLSGFTLVEVTLSLGIAVFTLIPMFGLLPVGLSSNQASIEQTAATGIATRISSDLRATTVAASGTTTAPASPLYKIPIPLPSATGSTYTVFLAEDGTLANSGGGDAILAMNPRYRVTLFFTPPANTPAAQRTATMARILVTWPAVTDKTANASPGNFMGSFETMVTLDRN